MTVSTRAAARRLRATALTAVVALALFALQVAFDGATRVRAAEGAPTVLKTISGVILTTPLSFATIATTAAPTTTAAPVLVSPIRTIANLDLTKDLAGLLTTTAPTTTAAPVLAIPSKSIANLDLTKDLAGLLTTTAATTTTIGSKIVSLTPTQIKALDGAAVGTLSPSVISQLSPTQLAALTEVTGTVAPTTTTLAIRTGGLLLDPSKILAIVPRDALVAAVSMTTTTVKGKSVVKLDSAVLSELKGVLAAAIGTTTTVRSRVTTKAAIDKAVLDKGVIAALRTTTTARSGVSSKSIPTKITSPDKGVSIKSIPIKITAPDKGVKVPIKITIPDKAIKPGKVPPIRSIPVRIPPIKGGSPGKSIPGVIIANPCLSAAVAAGSSARAAAAAAAVSKTPITVAATLSPAAASKLKVVGKDPCGGGSGAGASGAAGDPCNPGASGATPAATAPGKAKAASKSGKDCTSTAAAGATTTVKGVTTTVAALAGAAGGGVAPATEVPPGISMRMVPDVAAVGKVSTVVGAGFAPGAELQLAWSDGEAVGTVTADELGTFSFGVLLLPGAVIGNRTLQVVNDPALAALSADLMVLGSTGGGSSGRSSALMKR